MHTSTQPAPTVGSNPPRSNQIEPLHNDSHRQSDTAGNSTIAESLITEPASIPDSVDVEANQVCCKSQYTTSKQIEAVTAIGQGLTMVADYYLFDMFTGASQTDPGIRLFVEVVGCLRSIFCDQPCVADHEATRDVYVDNTLVIAQGLKVISRIVESDLILEGAINLSNSDQELFNWFTLAVLVIDAALFVALLNIKAD